MSKLVRSGTLARASAAFVAACAACLAAASAAALTLAEHEHTVWTAKQGLAGAVIWVDQVPNGMLLLRTSTGYQVFDGVGFHSYGPSQPPPPPGAHADLLGQRSPSGAVYFVDPQARKLMRAWQGRIEPVEDTGQAATLTTRFVFDAQGIGWMPALGRLYRLDGLKVEEVDGSWGLPKAQQLGNLVVDRRGTLWAGSRSSSDDPAALFYLPQGARRFESFALPMHCVMLELAPDGSPWCASAQGLVAVTLDGARPARAQVLSTKGYADFVFDRRGGFWISSSGRLQHADDWRKLREPGGIEALERDMMTTREGLASDAIWSLFQDADGNVWVATGASLERFRATRFTPMKLPRRDFGSAMQADPDGSLWVGNWDKSLMRVHDGRIDDIADVTQVTAIRRVGNGEIWVAGESGLWRRPPGGAFERVKAPAQGALPYVHQIAQDDSGAIWVLSGRELWRWKDDQWSRPEGPGVPPAGQHFYSFVVDPQRQLWFIGDRRGPFVLKAGAFRQIGDATYSAQFTTPYSAHARAGRVWVGQSTGVGYFEGEKFTEIKLEDDVAKQVSGVVETADGDVWLHGLAKAFRITAAQVAAAAKGETVRPQVFDFNDGLRAATSTIEPKPTLVEDASGRLWFSTNQGLFWLDPRSPPAEASAPPATLIRALQVDGAQSQPGPGLRLGANPGHVEFSYTAAALGASERVRFRYRLEGVDREWQDAGTRRTAYYTQLGPGRYRFEVAASNEQGQWAKSPTALDFEVLPAWYQTAWFRAVLGLLLLGLLWALYRLRMGVVAARERQRMRAIASERERIARDLHDTLLQSLQGAILGFQGLANGLPASDGTRRSIERQLDRADQLLGEARDRVRDLRATGDDATSLREAFELAAAELGGATRVEVSEEGRARRLRPLARDRIYLIGREAMLNAQRHGEASLVRVQLQFEPRRFTLRVRDDGRGIDAEVLAAGSRPGHFGLPGMRERAEQIGAAFKVSRGSGGGTEVELTVPAARAYEAGFPSRLAQQAA